VAAVRGVQSGTRGGEGVLGTLPRLVVCGGYKSGVGGGAVSELWGLDLATMWWEAMPALLRARFSHACCVVRGALVVLGGMAPRVGVPRDLAPTSRMEMLSKGEGAFVELPPLSCGAIHGAAAIAVDESHSVLGQELLLGGKKQYHTSTSSVRLVDLATGSCTLQGDLPHTRSFLAAARLPDGSIACAGSASGMSTATMWGPPVQGALDAASTWRELPAMRIGRSGCRGCVLSDGRFAVLGGYSSPTYTSSWEALTVGGDEYWSPLPPMHDSRGARFACAAVAECIIVAGGDPQRKSVEVFDDVLGRWLQLPHDLPCNGGLDSMDSMLL
jgi:hypothetical protein